MDAPGAVAAAVGRAELEASLAALRRDIGDPRAGLYGPASISWRVNREALLFLGGGRAHLLQLADPRVAAAVDAHSQARNDPHGRFLRTFASVFAMVFGDLERAERAARRVHAVHARVAGALDGAAGPFAAGARYAANAPDALMWVHATLLDTAVRVFELVVRPLAADERRRYYDESRRFAALFGIPDATLPRDWDAFEAYMQERLASDELVVTPGARELARFLLGAPAPWARPLADWYGAMTAGLLPERLRAGFGLRFGRRERAVFAASIRALRVARRVAPAGLRYQPVYREAMDRIAGRERPARLGRWAGRTLVRFATTRPG
jgi:uncharacterized protein (DUF2236 family)